MKHFWDWVGINPETTDMAQALRIMPIDGEPYRGLFEVEGIGNLFGTVRRSQWSGDLTPIAQVRTATRSPLAPISRDADGAIWLPFSTRDVADSLHQEAYKSTSPDRGGLLRGYYLIKPILPRALQLTLRQARASVISRRNTSFPSWPIEPGLVNLREWMLDKANEVLGPHAEIQPRLWPDGAHYCVTFTHDVEGAAGLRLVEEIATLEADRGIRSCWNFVPERDYSVPDSLITSLKGQGHEIGVHGLKHDGRLFDSRAIFDERMPMIRKYATEWDSYGFRSPATHRRAGWMSDLGFQYDSSYPDTDPYEPVPGGCCDVFPFFFGPVVELPVTMPQDLTLFDILKADAGSIWHQKWSWIKDHRGLVLFVVHPDYMSSKERLDVYVSLLDRAAADTSAWVATPKELADWWSSRSDTT